MQHIQTQLMHILENEYHISTDKILGIYPYGSATYGTFTEKSDYDFVVIADIDEDYIQFESSEMDIHIVSVKKYKQMLDEHDIMALETHFNPTPIKKFETDFKLNPQQLRRKISATVSNSWVKAKKKFTLENEDSYAGMKSLFHSIRILDFGIQIAEFGYIVDFKRVSHVWWDILNRVESGENFLCIMESYKQSHNTQATYFRKLAPLTE